MRVAITRSLERDPGSNQAVPSKNEVDGIRTIVQTDLPGLNLFRRGKVRDVYSIGDDLLIVATDRISAFDVVLPTAVPYKGAVLTGMSVFWFGFLDKIVDNHLITADAARYPAELQPHREVIERRSMLVVRADPVPFECVARRYLAGSAWKDYLRTGEVCGERLPAGLTESERLAEPIFTPATKAETGHDVNVSEAEMAASIGADLTGRLKALTLALYSAAAAYAYERGIIIADTKFEFGFKEDRLILIDEALTPDSSRFWPREGYSPGGPQPSFDKQYVRDYLESLDWNKTEPGPALTEEVTARTSEKYLEAYRLIAGGSVADFGS